MDPVTQLTSTLIQKFHIADGCPVYNECDMVSDDFYAAISQSSQISGYGFCTLDNQVLLIDEEMNIHPTCIGFGPSDEICSRGKILYDVSCFL